MSGFDLLWAFFLLSALQPMVRQRILDMSRARCLRELEGKRKSRVIALVHRQETMSLLGFPIARFINIEDSEAVLRAVQLTDADVPIDMILHTPGGLVLAAEQIANALVAHRAKVTVFVPHYAMSGGTLLACAADEIVMAPHAVLGPLDPQVGQFPAVSILRAVARKEQTGKDIDDQTLILADVAEKAQHQVRGLVERILVSNQWEASRAAPLASALTDGRWTHDYPLTVDEARQLGLPVTTGVPDEVYRFMQLFPQSTARRPSVEYVPVPYVAPPRPDGASRT
ncbi:MAG TPA: ATP-dependent Clp protease proteolytic subunit [Candidatus Eisenbacteria bacterium]|nr:ATP-dependent Clp protease proteolytic subunit [Candidatus Eisenbacteria bacterium]